MAKIQEKNPLLVERHKLQNQFEELRETFAAKARALRLSSEAMLERWQKAVDKYGESLLAKELQAVNALLAEAIKLAQAAIAQLEQPSS